MHVYFSTLLYCYEPGFQYFISPYLSYNSKRHNPKHSVKIQTVVKKNKKQKKEEKNVRKKTQIERQTQTMTYHVLQMPNDEGRKTFLAPFGPRLIPTLKILYFN